LVSSPSTPGAYLFQNANDRDKYSENLEEEKTTQTQRALGMDFNNSNKTLDLMNRLSDYLGK
jgi:hypothetical protein